MDSYSSYRFSNKESRKLIEVIIEFWRAFTLQEIEQEDVDNFKTHEGWPFVLSQWLSSDIVSALQEKMSGRAISKMECEKLAKTILKMREEFKFPKELTINDKNHLKEFKDNAYTLSLWIKNDTVFILNGLRKFEVSTPR